MNAAANQPPVLPNGLGHLSWAGHCRTVALEADILKVVRKHGIASGVLSSASVRELSADRQGKLGFHDLSRARIVMSPIARILALTNDSRHKLRMARSEPFQLTDADAHRAGLSAGDVGMWCLVVEGCYHLFESEKLARRAHEMLLAGKPVR